MKFQSMRLNKYLALQLGISRREADELIEAKRVKVGDDVARLGQQVSTEEIVTLDRQPILNAAAQQYIALNKPVGYVCSRRKQDASPTIYELLPRRLEHLKPVGRLDKDSSGLILLTNDGDFAHHMTHPKFRKRKIYEVKLDKPLKGKDKKAIEDGITLEDGLSRLAIKTKQGFYQVTMHEGRNRQIRRTFAALGYKVTKLYRTEFGNFKIDDLPPSQYREIAI